MEKYLSIPGLLSNGRCRIITEEVIPLLPGSPMVLEIGSFLGKSTVMWLDKLPNGATLDINDSFEMTNKHIFDVVKTWIKGDHTELFDFLNKGGDHFGAWKMHTDSHPRSQLIRNIFRMRTNDLLFDDKFNNHYDCVFLDANHQNDDVTKQLEYFKECNLICGDDFETDNWPGVVSAVTKFVEENNRVLHHKRGVFWITK
jgi:predicted O-methyltransferase YrrM